MKKFRHSKFLILALLTYTIFSHAVSAGSLTPSVAPLNTMYTIDGIYNKIVNNTVSVSEGAQTLSTPSSVVTTFHTLKQLYDIIPRLDARYINFDTTYMGVQGTLYPKRGLPKTGQITCWPPSDPSVTTPCSGTGEDGDYQAGVAPDIGTRFTDNGDGTIKDEATILMWKKCSEGQSGSDCSEGSIDNHLDWYEALAACEADTTAGYTDWRLPNRNELLSIVNLDQTPSSLATIDATYFPNTPNAEYQTSSSYQIAGETDRVWKVNFFDGAINRNSKSNSYYVRCVR